MAIGATGKLSGLLYAARVTTLFRMIMMQPARLSTLAIVTAAILACAKTENTTTTSDSTASTTSSTTTTTTTTDTANAPVRGTLASLTDNSVTVAARTGNITLAIAQPFAVYSRVPAKLADVTSNSFVGVTSVAQPDGSQRATEIHIFPEALRGMGEGSRPMGGPNGGRRGGGGSNMTNGTVSGSQMTNGTASTMTNGTISGQNGGTLTVQYAGGTQTITVPANVTVTAIAPTQTKPAPGANVVVLTAKQPDGSVRATGIMVAGDRSRRR